MTKAFLRRQKEFDHMTQDNPRFRVWLGLDAVEWLEDETERTNFFKWYGHAPQFITDALRQWGSLTEKQYRFALSKFTEQLDYGRQRYESRQAEQQALVQSGRVWSEGRREVTLEIVSIKERMFGPKMLGKTPDGMKLWVSLPNGAGAQKGNRIKMTVTIKPSPDDPTFAFGSRPSKWALL